jgi:hypothetical protein
MAPDREDNANRVSLEGLDPEEALKALLAVDPDAPPVDEADDGQPEPAKHDSEDI